MDAVKFLQERSRMYKSGAATPGIGLEDDYNPVSAVEVVEKWAAEHPRKTRQDMFLEQFPNVELDRNGIINISPCKVDPKQYPFNGKNCRKFQRCGECLREFWMQEVE